jgi:nucleotide-binding universal stress UspA family protein
MSKSCSIVVAFDFSDDATRAVHRAAALAAVHNARLRLLHVVGESVLEPLPYWFGSRARADAATDRTRASLGELAGAIAGEYRIDAEAVIRRGNVVEEVLRFSDEADLRSETSRAAPSRCGC